MTSPIKEVVTYIIHENEDGRHIAISGPVHTSHGLKEAVRVIVEAYLHGGDSEAMAMATMIATNTRLTIGLMAGILAEKARDSAVENESEDVENARDTAGE